MPLLSYLVGLVGCSLGSHMSRLRHLGWNPCSHGLTSRPLESCHHQCLKAICGVLGYPKGSALELLDGTLKLRYCTDLFTKRFPLGLYPGLDLGLVKGILLHLVILWKQVVMGVKGSDLPGRHVQVLSRGAQGHGPVNLLLISAAEIGFAWDGSEKGWVRVSLPPLRMMTGPIQHFRAAILDAWHFHVFSRFSERKGFRGAEFADS